MELFILSDLSWGDLGHMEHPENPSRAELFQELVPHQITLQIPRVTAWMEIWEAEPTRRSNLNEPPHLQSPIMNEN